MPLSPEFTVNTSIFCTDENMFCSRSDYSELLSDFAVSAAKALDDPSCIYHPPGLSPDSDAVLRVSRPSEISGAENLAELVCSCLEDRLYGSPVRVDKFHVFRHIPGRLSLGGSFSWHVDGHPSEFVKVLIYLSDVDEASSYFEILYHEQRRRALRVASIPTELSEFEEGQAREGVYIPNALITERIQRGYRITPILGPAGTYVVFGTNCVHRATETISRPRDCVILRINPASATAAKSSSRLDHSADIGASTMLLPPAIAAEE